MIFKIIIITKINKFLIDNSFFIKWLKVNIVNKVKIWSGGNGFMSGRWVRNPEQQQRLCHLISCCNSFSTPLSLSPVTPPATETNITVSTPTLFSIFIFVVHILALFTHQNHHCCVFLFYFPQGLRRCV